MKQYVHSEKVKKVMKDIHAVFNQCMMKGYISGRWTGQLKRVEI